MQSSFVVFGLLSELSSEHKNSLTVAYITHELGIIERGRDHPQGPFLGQ